MYTWWYTTSYIQCNSIPCCYDTGWKLWYAWLEDTNYQSMPVPLTCKVVGFCLAELQSSLHFLLTLMPLSLLYLSGSSQCFSLKVSVIQFFSLSQPVMPCYYNLSPPEVCSNPSHLQHSRWITTTCTEILFQGSALCDVRGWYLNTILWCMTVCRILCQAVLWTYAVSWDKTSCVTSNALFSQAEREWMYRII